MEEDVLADSRSLKVETYRKKNGLWIYDAFENHEQITFHSLGLSLSLADIYADADFEDATRAL